MKTQRKLDYSAVTDNLLVGKTPYGKDYKILKDMGINLVINMRAEWPMKLVSKQKLVQEVWLPSIDSRYFPLNQKRFLEIATKAKMVIEDGGKVYVYCRKGRHRSIVMVAAILTLQGHNVDSLQKFIAEKRPVSDMRAIQVASAITIFDKSQGLKS